MKNEKFSILKRIKSFKYAFNGLRVLIIEEHNARIHLMATILVLIAGVFFKISVIEWGMIAFSIGFVFSMEAINSAIENLSDFVSPNKHKLIKKVKDLSAAAVLISAITSLIIGCLVFIPKIINLLYK